MWFEKCLDALPAVKGLKGRPRRRPAKLHADKGYDYKRCRGYLKRRGITSRIARKGIESSKRLGKHRWVVERTHGWFAGFGKLRIRFERQLQTHQALLLLAAAIICSRFFMQRSCWRLLVIARTAVEAVTALRAVQEIVARIARTRNAVSHQLPF